MSVSHHLSTNLQAARFIVQHICQARSARARYKMPRIENSQLDQPQEGNIQLIATVLRPLNDSPALYLEIPLVHLASLCERPRKYLRYPGCCIMGVEGHRLWKIPRDVTLREILHSQKMTSETKVSCSAPLSAAGCRASASGKGKR
jgi:hypothetical protein